MKLLIDEDKLVDEIITAFSKQLKTKRKWRSAHSDTIEFASLAVNMTIAEVVKQLKIK